MQIYNTKMNPNHIFDKIAKDIQVDVSEEFDRNFERKAFFDRKWPQTKHQYSRGSLMMRSGRGRKSIQNTRTGGTIKWHSSLPYMGIHNSGGEIEVTARMKAYFWAMYYKAAGAVQKNKNGGVRNTTRNQALNDEAKKWKYMALQPVGKKMVIDQRQIVGDHPVVRERINFNFENNLKEVEKYINQKFKK